MMIDLCVYGIYAFKLNLFWDKWRNDIKMLQIISYEQVNIPFVALLQNNFIFFHP